MQHYYNIKRASVLCEALLLVYIAFSVSTARSDLTLFPGLLAIISAIILFFMAFLLSKPLISRASGHNFRHYSLFYGFFTLHGTLRLLIFGPCQVLMQLHHLEVYIPLSDDQPYIGTFTKLSSTDCSSISAFVKVLSPYLPSPRYSLNSPTSKTSKIPQFLITDFVHYFINKFRILY